MYSESGSVEYRLRELERRLSVMERADRLGNTSWTEPGVIRYRTADGTVVLYLGTVNVGGEPVGFGLLVADTDGQRRFSASPQGVFVDGPAGSRAAALSNTQRTIYSMGGVDHPRVLVFTGSTDEVLQLRDDAGQTLIELGDDGVRHPYLTVPLAPRNLVVPDGEWTNVAEGWVRRYGSHLRVDVGASLVTDNTVQVRVRDTSTDTVVAGPVTVSASGYTQLIAELPGAYRSRRFYRVEARRSAGAAGTNQVWAVGAEQSSLLAP